MKKNFILFSILFTWLTHIVSASHSSRRFQEAGQYAATQEESSSASPLILSEAVRSHDINEIEEVLVKHKDSIQKDDLIHSLRYTIESKKNHLLKYLIDSDLLFQMFLKDSNLLRRPFHVCSKIK